MRTKWVTIGFVFDKNMQCNVALYETAPKFGNKRLYKFKVFSSIGSVMGLEGSFDSKAEALKAWGYSEADIQVIAV